MSLFELSAMDFMNFILLFIFADFCSSKSWNVCGINGLPISIFRSRVQAGKQHLTEMQGAYNRPLWSRFSEDPCIAGVLVHWVAPLVVQTFRGPVHSGSFSALGCPFSYFSGLYPVL